jgi:uncharacterized membrane protein YphA (DoxX/SURF4 family)
MQMRHKLLAVTTALFLTVLALSWVFHGTGVVRNDLSRNIYIPETLTMPLQVKAAYDGKNIYFRYRWPAREPHIYHDMLKYEGGKWVRIGASVPGPQPQGIYEDRVTMLVDDGSVPEFEKYGGYITIGDGMRFFTREASKKEVQAHPYLGAKMKQEEVRKHLPETRADIADWRSVVPEDRLAAQRKAGYFLDLWHWRAHRSNPIGASDDELIAEGRFGDKGKGPFTNNWDAKLSRPQLMFDPAKTGGRVALRWEDLAARKLGFDDLYYLREDQAKPFDPGHAWKDGDVIPQRLLRAGDDSHADIKVHGNARWKDGTWDVTLVRAMDTGHPLDDKIFMDQRVYTVAFAVHRDATGSRWHYVSLPVRLGLGREADLKAAAFSGDAPKWEQDWHEVKLFYPGQVSWPMLRSSMHAGASKIRQGVPVKFRHSEAQLAHYGVEMEFNDAIIRQWLLTLAAGLLLIVGLGIAVIRLIGTKRSAT